MTRINVGDMVCDTGTAWQYDAGRRPVLPRVFEVTSIYAVDGEAMCYLDDFGAFKACTLTLAPSPYQKDA